MGLIKNLQLDNGIIVKNAYFNINSIAGDPNEIKFSLESYKTRDDYLEGIPMIDNKFYNFEPDLRDEAPNFIRQIYSYLKKTDDFRDAEDVLEGDQSPLD